MKTTIEESVVKQEIYTCEVCDYSTTDIWCMRSHEKTSHIQKQYIDNTVLYYVNNEEELNNLKSQFGGKWFNQTLPAWYVHYEYNDRSYYCSIKNHITDLEEKAEEIQKQISEFRKLEENHANNN